MARYDVSKHGFKKGDPRINRKGAPRKMPILKALMTELLGTKEGQDMTKSELGNIAKAMIATAKNKKSFNQMNATKEILDRVFGKVKSEGEDGGPMAGELHVNVTIVRE